MRTAVPFVTALTLVVGTLGAPACGGGDDGNQSDGGNDAEPGDGSVDGDTPDADPGPGCSALSPRTTPLEAFTTPTGFQTRMNAFIESAQHTLDIQMYLFTVTGLMDKVIAAKNRGVTVRVLLDPDHDGNATARSRFTSGGVTWRDDPSIYTFAHAKYLIADGTSAIIMSSNFNVDALSSERNYGVVDKDVDDVADLKAIFEQDWAGAGGGPAQPADLSCTRLVVSPTNSRTRIMELINSAMVTLDVEALYVSEDGVRDAIVAAKMRGATVRVILSPDSDDAMAKPYFASKGIPVHDASGFYLHAKLLIADGKAFVGSENFSITALTRNREVGVFVGEASQNAIIQTQFNSDFSSTH